MSYIDKNLLPDESILFRTKKHRIVFALPVLFTLFALVASTYMHANEILFKLAGLPWLLALLFWGYVGLDYITSEFAVTNKRLMMREGFFYRHSNQMRLSAISQVNVDQSLLGQWLDYGMVSINAFGAFDAFPLIAKPFQFQQAVNQELDKVAR